MKNKKIFIRIMLVITLAFVMFLSIGKVEAKVTYKYDGSTDGIGLHAAYLDGDKKTAFCLHKNRNHPPDGKKLTCSDTNYTGSKLYIYASNYSRVNKQRALWIFRGYDISSKFEAAHKLAKAAKKRVYNGSNPYDPRPKISMGSIGSITSTTGTYYYKNFNVSTTNVKDNKYTISLSGAPSGTAVYTTSGAKITGETDAKTVQVRVPISSATAAKSFKVTVTSKSTSHLVALVCQYSSSYQTIEVPYKKSDKVSATKEASIPKNGTCKKIGSVYTNKAGAVVSEENYLKSCKNCASGKDNITKKYVDNSGKIHTSESSYLKACFKCGKYGNYWIDANGTKYPSQTAAWNKSCKGTCTKIGEKYYDRSGNAVGESGYLKSCKNCASGKDNITKKYVDNSGNSYTSETKEYLEACFPCQKHGNYWIGKNGEKLNSEEEMKASCYGRCVESNGKYYDINGNLVDKDTYIKSCMNPCQKGKNGKYYDKLYNEYTSETKEYLKSCFSCQKHGDEYINNEGEKVSEADYYKACNPKCVVSDGKYYDINGKTVSKEEYYKSCNDPCVKKDGKYYDKNGKPVDADTYYKSCIPLTPDVAPLKSVDADLIRYEKEFHYTIKHEVPHRSASDFYKSYVFTDMLEEPFQIKRAASIRIVQTDKATEKETDWTDKFDIKVDGQKITATLKQKELENKNFYGTRDASDKEYNKEYKYIITVSLKDQADAKYDMKKYKTEDGYIIPDTANVSIINSEGKTESKDTNKVDVKYVVPSDPMKNVSSVNQTASYENGTTFKYNIIKFVPAYKGNQKYSSFEFKDVFEDPILISSEKDLVIRDDSMQDVTKWFDVKLKGQKLTATLKEKYNVDDFYGHAYEFFVTARINQGAKLKKYLHNGRYEIPNYATFTFDNNTQKTNVAKVTVDLKAKPNIPIPNTASPMQVALIAAGVAIIISAVGSVLHKYKILPIKK